MVHIIKIVTLQGSDTTKKGRKDPSATAVLAAYFSVHGDIFPLHPSSPYLMDLLKPSL